MLHKIKIVIVVLADLLQPIGEFLAAGEQLLETTKAAGHRFTAGVNDSGVGQNQSGSNQYGGSYLASCR